LRPSAVPAHVHHRRPDGRPTRFPSSSRCRSRFVPYRGAICLSRSGSKWKPSYVLRKLVEVILPPPTQAVQASVKLVKLLMPRRSMAGVPCPGKRSSRPSHQRDQLFTRSSSGSLDLEWIAAHSAPARVSVRSKEKRTACDSSRMSTGVRFWTPGPVQYTPAARPGRFRTKDQDENAVFYLRTFSRTKRANRPRRPGARAV